jgi:adenine-specific DNA methylase
VSGNRVGSGRRLIESDSFPFEFVSELAEMESWRKEVYRPIYHIHKWWANRLGSVFRAILLGSALPDDESLAKAFYRQHDFSGLTVFDPFMGSGTTVGEAHKLGFTALGRDINPVACESVRVAMGPLDRDALLGAFGQLSAGVGERIRGLYRSADQAGHECDALYFFFAWQRLGPSPFVNRRSSTRHAEEVQDASAERFSRKLRAVFRECHRGLRDDGLLVFTYHHSRADGWTSLAEAVVGAGFDLVNAHPLKAEMSVAAPKSQAKEP